MENKIDIMKKVLNLDSERGFIFNAQHFQTVWCKVWSFPHRQWACPTIRKAKLAHLV